MLERPSSSPEKGKARQDESARIILDGRPSAGDKPRSRLHDDSSELRRHNSEPSLVIPRGGNANARSVHSPTFGSGSPTSLAASYFQQERVNFIHSDLRAF